MENINAFVDIFLACLQRRELKNLVDLFAEEFYLEIPGNTVKIKWLGSRRSKPEVEQLFKLLWSAVEPLTAAIQTVLTNEDQAIIKGNFTSKMLETGRLVSSVFFIHLRIHNHKIIEYTLLEDSYAVSEALR
ncbi:nuclear transport factor 2 family protein [Sphingobacterium sp. ML3W]|uniref:nuclear transport factor 2 family protein n=1 Tax=Sphingobacterium sp. ML3W TaxID=1538644 RepID=UPI00249C6A3A|nr:nuclear transport factor 2 family protein [Sphingobacterium sp. ML3W]WFA80225.1 nuclear transport factor 2 family protein [Sphingobacterium sp. ML3W]